MAVIIDDVGPAGATCPLHIRSTRALPGITTPGKSAMAQDALTNLHVIAGGNVPLHPGDRVVVVSSKNESIIIDVGAPAHTVTVSSVFAELSAGVSYELAGADDIVSVTVNGEPLSLSSHPHVIRLA